MTPPIPRWLALAQDGFVLWVLLGAAWGWLWPQAAAPGAPLIPAALGVVMLGMGLTLTVDDLRGLLGAGPALFLGLVLQYLCMPVAALLVARALALPPELALGLILVGAAPGGTASNVVTFLARGDVALSVAMTTASTLVSPLFTPLWVSVLAAAWLPVDAAALTLTMAKVVLAPLLLGVLIRRLWTPSPMLLAGALPVASMAVIAWIVGVVVALGHDRLAAAGPAVAAAVACLNALGLAGGWLGARWAGLRARQRRAVAIEVGMQNSGLAVALAVAHFSPLAALPGALFSIWHNVSGPLLASLWRRLPDD